MGLLLAVRKKEKKMRWNFRSKFQINTFKIKVITVIRATSEKERQGRRRKQ